MKLSWNWLRELVDLDGLSAAEGAEAISLRTAEVEEVETVGASLDGVYVAEVLSVEPHPDADRLRVCQVKSRGETLQVVCGAPNVAAGQRIAFAPVGTVLADAPGGSLKLKKAKIRGVESHGMICAEDELGLGDDHDGILVLADDAPLDVSLGSDLGLSDTIIEVGNTAITHRPDLWGHIGFARELGAIFARKLTLPDVGDLASLETGAGEPYPIQIADAVDCRRYVGLVIEGVANGPSPLARKVRLERLGVRSIDALVDLTNHVLLEYGQPLHAFDLAKLRGGRIDVRRAAPGEKIACLDDVERTLDAEDLVIADGEGPVAMAGVMGSAPSGVGAATTAVLLESATFEPARIRRTAQRHGLRTEASSRFEKTLDPENAAGAALRYLQLLRELCPDATVCLPATDVYPAPYPEVRVSVPYDQIRRALGVRFPDGRIRRRLGALGFDVSEVRDSIAVGVPSWRATKDIAGPEDIIEEAGRICGYEEIPHIAPIFPASPTLPPADRALSRRAKGLFCLGQGYREARHHAFYGARKASAFGIAEHPHLELAHPASEDEDRLIATAAPNLVDAAARNQAKHDCVDLCETTHLFGLTGADGLPHEHAVLALLRSNAESSDDPAGSEYLAVVNDLRRVLDRLGIKGVEVRDGAEEALAAGLPSPAAWLHPGRACSLHHEGKRIAIAGEIAPAVMRAMGLRGRAAVAELLLDGLCELRTHESSYSPLLRYPVVPFDVAVLVPRKTLAGEVQTVIAAAAEGAVRDVRAFDAYEGKGVPEGQRSLAFTCEFFDTERTLDGERAAALRASVIDALETRGWHVRKADD